MLVEFDDFTAVEAMDMRMDLDDAPNLLFGIGGFCTLSAIRDRWRLSKRPSEMSPVIAIASADVCVSDSQNARIAPPRTNTR